MEMLEMCGAVPRWEVEGGTRQVGGGAWFSPSLVSPGRMRPRVARPQSDRQGKRRHCESPSTAPQGLLKRKLLLWLVLLFFYLSCKEFQRFK